VNPDHRENHDELYLKYHSLMAGSNAD
jgi:hypothetical protein